MKMLRLVLVATLALSGCATAKGVLSAACRANPTLCEGPTDPKPVDPPVDPPPTPKSDQDPKPTPSPEAPPAVDEPAIPEHHEGHLVEDGKGGKSSYWKDVNLAIDFAIGQREPGFAVTDWQDFYRSFREKLTDLGYAVNYDWTSGDQDPAVTPPRNRYDSEFTIWRLGGCRIEAFQVLQSAKKVRRATETGGAYRAFAYISSCSALRICVDQGPAPNPLNRFEVKVHNVGPSWLTIDSTPLVGAPNGDRDRVYCKLIGFTDDRGYCPPRQEGSPERSFCDEVVAGGTSWYFDGQEVLVGHPFAERLDNRFQLRVRPGHPGVARICSEHGPCSQVAIQ